MNASSGSGEWPSVSVVPADITKFARWLRASDCLVSGLRAFQILLLNPGHQSAQTRAGFFDRMLLPFGEQALVVLIAAFVFSDPALRELPALNVFQGRLHPLLHTGV